MTGMKQFKFFCDNIQDEPEEVGTLQRSLRDLVNKWEPTGFLEDAVCPELVATVMETTVSYFIGSINDYTMTILLPTLSRIFRYKERYYSDERIISLAEELINVIELNEFNPTNYHTRLDWEAEMVGELYEFFNWDE